MEWKERSRFDRIVDAAVRLHRARENVVRWKGSEDHWREAERFWTKILESLLSEERAGIKEDEPCSR